MLTKSRVLGRVVRIPDECRTGPRPEVFTPRTVVVNVGPHELRLRPRCYGEAAKVVMTDHDGVEWVMA